MLKIIRTKYSNIYHQGSSVCIVGKNYEEELDNLSKITQDY